MKERGMCASLSRSGVLAPTGCARVDWFRGTYLPYRGIKRPTHGVQHVASWISSLEVRVASRDSLWVWRYGGPNLQSPSAQFGPPLLPQTSPLKHTYLHAPFDLSEHSVQPELQFELGTRCKLWHVRARRHHGATALPCSPLHTPLKLASCPHMRPSYPPPYLPRISMDRHVNGHYRRLRITTCPKPCVLCPESKVS